jgi:plastocyanin
MRATPALWGIVIVLGVGLAVFSLWSRRADAPGAPPENGPARHVTVVMRNFVFEPREITIPVGTTVDWIDTVGQHAIDFDDSGVAAGKDDALSVGGSVSRTFQTPGRYSYHCAVHGAVGGNGMAGVVIVTAP